MLRCRGVVGPRVLEGVAADRNPHAGNQERLDQIFQVVGVGGAKLIAVLQVEAEVPARLAGLERVTRVGDVLEAALEMVLADHLPPLRPWTEPQTAEVAAERLAPQKADLRVEVVFERYAIDEHAVAIAGVTEVTPVAVVLPIQPRRPGSCDVAGQIDVLE